MTILCRFLIISLFFFQGAIAQVPFFIQGRERLEKEIIQSIGSSKFTNLYGLSGMGKTTISKKIKEVMKKNGHNVIWLNWDLISITEQINNIMTENNCHSLQHFIKKMSNQRLLIVIVDNYTELDLKKLNEVLGGLFISNKVKFVISSRQKIMDADEVQISSFTEEEALSLMINIFPQKKFIDLKILLIT